MELADLGELARLNAVKLEQKALAQSARGEEIEAKKTFQKALNAHSERARINQVGNNIEETFDVWPTQSPSSLLELKAPKPNVKD